LVVRPAPAFVENADRHEADIPVDARDAEAVVPCRPDRARDVRAVAVLVTRVAVVVHEVVTREHVRRQVGVVVGDAGIDNCDGDCAASRGEIPSLRPVDVGIARLTEAPELSVSRVVRRESGVVDEVWLGVENLRPRLELVNRGFDGCFARKLKQLGTGEPQPLLSDGVRLLENSGAAGAIDSRLETHEHLAWDELPLEGLGLEPLSVASSSSRSSCCRHYCEQEHGSHP
jgi:hypothetical protein